MSELHVKMILLILMFLIPSIEPAIEGGGQVTVTRGRAFIVKCRLDDFYEFCTFRLVIDT